MLPDGTITTERRTRQSHDQAIVFDSGVGGLSVAAAIRREQPGADIIYVADDAGFPYGEWEDAALTERVIGLISGLIAHHRPDAVVIACNTASTLVLPPLRARFDIPFVGSRARDQANWRSARERRGRRARHLRHHPPRPYPRADRVFAKPCHVRLVGSGNLTPYAERHMRGEAVEDAAILAEIAPAFTEEDGRRTTSSSSPAPTTLPCSRISSVSPRGRSRGSTRRRPSQGG